MNDNDNNLIFFVWPHPQYFKIQERKKQKKNLGHMSDYREKLFSMLSIYLFTFSPEKKAINTKKNDLWNKKCPSMQWWWWCCWVEFKLIFCSSELPTNRQRDFAFHINYMQWSKEKKNVNDDPETYSSSVFRCSDTKSITIPENKRWGERGWRLFIIGTRYQQILYNDRF